MKYLIKVVAIVAIGLLIRWYASTLEEFPQDRLNEFTALAIAGLLIINLAPDRKRSKNVRQ